MKKEVDEGLQAALKNLGYAKVTKKVFRAPWGSEAVAHFVQLDWFHSFGQFERLQLALGIRHHDSQAFAAAMWEEFGNPYARGLIQYGPTDCLVGVYLGKVCSWPLFAIFLTDFGIEGSVRLVVDSLEGRLRPLVQHIRDDATMYAFLTQTENEQLYQPNGATRAAASIFLGKRLGYAKSRVLMDNAPFWWAITGQIDRARSVGDFLERAWDLA